MSYSSHARADELDEHTLKAAYLYNFAVYTTWPDTDASTFNLCIYGNDPFGKNLDSLMQKKRVNDRTITIHRTNNIDRLDLCQLVFISHSSIDNLKAVIITLQDKPVLIVADSPGTIQQGVALNMEIKDEKITFDANLKVARKAGLNLSSQLLRFATSVLQ
ncbi:YfiR family protein [Nitrosomonas sp.]|uniref:YfiR family protein n=1 Tax=Nitrosomonas sp. TaxID=42353 RepID=UPI0025EB9E66|nr:YfiR family protein [Nitrosomonas sp.]